MDKECNLLNQSFFFQYLQLVRYMLCHVLLLLMLLKAVLRQVEYQPATVEQTFAMAKSSLAQAWL